MKSKLSTTIYELLIHAIANDDSMVEWPSTSHHNRVDYRVFRRLPGHRRMVIYVRVPKHARAEAFPPLYYQIDPPFNQANIRLASSVLDYSEAFSFLRSWGIGGKRANVM
jgi:hypothetical protein